MLEAGYPACKIPFIIEASSRPNYNTTSALRLLVGSDFTGRCPISCSRSARSIRDLIVDDDSTPMRELLYEPRNSEAWWRENSSLSSLLLSQVLRGRYTDGCIVGNGTLSLPLRTASLSPYHCTCTTDPRDIPSSIALRVMDGVAAPMSRTTSSASIARRGSGRSRHKRNLSNIEPPSLSSPTP